MKCGNTLKVLKRIYLLLKVISKHGLMGEKYFILIFKAIADLFSYLTKRILILYENNHFAIQCKKIASF